MRDAVVVRGSLGDLSEVCGSLANLMAHVMAVHLGQSTGQWANA